MNTIELIPDASALIEATRSIGYFLDSAISDLLDNSISAYAKNIWLDFSVSSNKPYLTISDDGIGMNRDTLINAMKYGSHDPAFSRKKDDLGRFGLGLKTASMSQCRKFSVFSKQQGVCNGLMWDLDYVRESGKWNVIELGQDYIETKGFGKRFSEMSDGTIVIWEELDRLSEGNQVNVEEIISKKMIEVENHLSLVFHRYLSGEKDINKINIYLNNRLIKPFDPFLTSKSTKFMDDEKVSLSSISIMNQKIDAQVVITPYLLPHPNKMTKKELELYGGENLKKNQGFYIYRNKRLIIWGTWFRLLKTDDAYKLARVKVEIPNSLDDLWALDIKKSTATPPYILRSTFRKIVERLAEQSKRTYTFKKEIETKDSLIHVWKRIESLDGIDYCINLDHPIISDFVESLSKESSQKMDLIMKIIETSLPLNTLFIDYSSDKKHIAGTNDEDTEKLEHLIRTYFGLCQSSEDLNKAVELLQKLDIFDNQKDLILEVKEEFYYGE